MFVILYVINFIVLFLGKRKFKKNKKNSLRVYLNKIYGINVNKEMYERYIWTFSFVNTFIIDTVYIIIIYLLKNVILRFIFGIILIILLTIICYGILARIILMKEGKKDV